MSSDTEIKQKGCHLLMSKDRISRLEVATAKVLPLADIAKAFPGRGIVITGSCAYKKQSLGVHQPHSVSN